MYQRAKWLERCQTATFVQQVFCILSLSDAINELDSRSCVGNSKAVSLQYLLVYSGVKVAKDV